MVTFNLILMSRLLNLDASFFYAIYHFSDSVWYSGEEFCIDFLLLFILYITQVLPIMFPLKWFCTLK